MKVNPRDMKHKFRKVFPCPFNTINHPKTTVISCRTPKASKELINVCMPPEVFQKYYELRYT